MFFQPRPTPPPLLLQPPLLLIIITMSTPPPPIIPTPPIISVSEREYFICQKRSMQLGLKTLLKYVFSLDSLSRVDSEMRLDRPLKFQN